MSKLIAIIVAIVTIVLAWLTGRKGEIFISLVGEESKETRETIAACEPVLSWYTVSFFERVPYPDQPGMFGSKWVKEKVQAYSALEAAAKFGKRPGYSCFVSRQMGG